MGQAFSSLRFDRRSGGALPLTPHGWELDMLPYLSGCEQTFLCQEDTHPGNASLARLRIAVYNGSTWKFDFVVRQKHGWVQKHNETGNSYELWFEDGVDEDFNDLKLLVEELPSGQTKLSVLSRDAAYHFDLIELPSRKPLFSRLGEGDDDQSYSVPTMRSSYGINSLLNEINPGRRVILAMDYSTSVAQCAGDGPIDDWNDMLDDEGVYRFARHSGECNVLFADGSVKLTAPLEIHPASQDAVDLYWTP